MNSYLTETTPLLDEIFQNFDLKSFNPMIGCEIRCKKDLLLEIQELPESPFKLFVQLQLNLVDQPKNAEDYMDEFYDYETVLAPVFYLNFRAHFVKSKIDEVQLRKIAQNIFINKKHCESPEDRIALFFASLHLGFEQIDDIIQIQASFVTFLQTARLSSQLVLDTLLFCFPLRSIQTILAKNYINNVQYELAFNLLSSLKGYEVECSELLYNTGKQSRDQALQLLQFQLKRELGSEVLQLLTDNFVYDEGFLHQNLQKFTFHLPRGFANLQQFSAKLTILGEYLNNPHIFGLCIALNLRNDRAFRDLGVFFITEFSQKNIDVEKQKQIIVNASYLLMCAFKLNPHDRACRENLATLLILTKSQLQQARQIYLSLLAEFQECKEYYQNIAIIDYSAKNYKSALDFYLKAEKLNYRFDNALMVQILELLCEIKEKLGEFRCDQVLPMLERSLDVFNNYKTSSSWKSNDEKITYIQNFLYRTVELIKKLFNWVADLEDQQGQQFNFQNGKRIFNKWLEFVQQYCGTTAGDEVLGVYVNLYKRFENK